MNKIYVRAIFYSQMSILKQSDQLWKQALELYGCLFELALACLPLETIWVPEEMKGALQNTYVA